MKVCTKCGIEKPMDEFWNTTHPGSKDGKHWQCAECKRKYHRKRWNGYDKWNKAYRRARQQYGLTDVEYSYLLMRANGRCESCGAPQKNMYSTPIDHDHTCCPTKPVCGKCVRGLLCIGCNVKVGTIETANLAQLLAYLAPRSLFLS